MKGATSAELAAGNAVPALQDTAGSVALLMNHPRFAEAARLFVRLTLQASAQDANICKLFGDSASHIAFSVIATYSARFEANNGSPPFSLSHLLAAMEPWGMGSHGKIEAIVNRMVDQGLLQRAPSPDDRRRKLILPTENFLAMDDVLCALHAKPSAMLVEDHLVARIAVGDREAVRHMRASHLQSPNDSIAILQRVPRMLVFLVANGGWLVLCALLDASWNKDAQASRPVSIARKCRVSRAHIANLFARAVEHNLLQKNVSGTHTPTLDFLDDVNRFIAECLWASIAWTQSAKNL